MADARWTTAWRTGGAPEDPRLLRTLTGHEGWVTAVATAIVDGRAVAVTGSRDHTVRTWDLATGRQLHTPLVCRADAWTSTTAEVEHIATAAVDGRAVALLLERLGRQKRVLLLDPARGLPAGECVRVVETAELDGLGAVLLTLEGDRTLRLWSVATGAEIGSALPARIVVGRHDEPVAVRAEAEGAVRTWNLAGEVLGEPGPSDPPDGSADGATEGAAVVVGGRLVAVAFHAVGLAGFLDGETAVAVAGELAAACGRRSGEVVPGSQVAEVDGRPVGLVRQPDGALRLWDRGARGETCRTDGDGWVVTTAALRGQRIRRPRDVDGQQDWTWQLVHPAAALDPTGAAVTDPGGTALPGPVLVAGRAIRLTADADHAVRLRDAATDVPQGERLAGHTDRIRAAAAMTTDGGQVRAVTTGLDRTVRVWDVATGTPVGEPLDGHTAQVWDVATAVVDGRPVAVTAGADHTLRVWDLAQTGGPPLPAAGGHDAAIAAVAATTLRGRPVVVTAGADGTVRTWDAATGSPIGEPVAAEAALMAAAEADGGSPVVVTAAPDATLHRWDPVSGRAAGEPVALPSGRILALATARVDGRGVAVTGGSDGTARVWDLTTGEPLGQPLTGHTSRITALATAAADGRAVAVTGSWDKTVRLWDLTTGRQIGEPLTGHTDWVTSVTTTVVDGHPVAVTAGRDATIRVWSLRTHRQLGEPLPAPAGAIRGMTATVLDGGTLLITADGTETLSVHDLTAGAGTASALTFPAPVHAVLATADGWLVVGHGREVSVLVPASPGGAV
ncbi:WD40 repeat domain-containing protein [Streptomyces sp. NPDC001388]|uniref:WD40 repeat domain-containing protein n=1 Tax=Streptomyces sp. NPDC001388 TaxID=3364568 RepID=UPI0036889CF8